MAAKVKVALLGTGGIAGKHARSLLTNPDAQIVAGCDVSEMIVQKFFEKHLPGYAPPPAVFADAAKMYAQAKPDAVIICTPHTLHFDHGMQALQAGCHVMMEKPMVTSVDHAYKLKEKVRQTGKVFTIAYNTPCSPEFHYLRQLIRAKELGRLEMVCGYISQDWLKLTAGKWRQDPALSGGGQAYDSGAHLLNSLCWSVECPLEEVFAYLDNHGSKVDINTVLVAKFRNGVLASLCVGGNCTANGRHMSFLFDGGLVEIDGWGGSWINVFKGKDKVKYPLITGEAIDPAKNFIDAILGRDEPRTSPDNGIIQSELMEAVYESVRTGKPSRVQSRLGK